MIHYSIDNNIAILTFNRQDAPVNSINPEFTQILDQEISKALEDDKVKGIILTSSKNDFVVGADIKAVSKDAPELFINNAKAFKAVLRKMESGGKPVVSAINGTALGGGYEIALASHYRIALDNPKLIIGLPEVQLGLLPGGGGTMRLPRLIGIEPSLKAMLEGRKYNVQEALKLNMIDTIAADTDEMLNIAKQWINDNQEAVQPWDRKGFTIPGGGPQTSKLQNIFSATAGILTKKTQGHYPAPYAILNAVYEGCLLEFDRSSVVEDRYFVQCVQSDVSRNLIRTLFLNLNKANKGIARPAGIPQKNLQKVGILGAGMMGAGIAYVSAISGIEVTLKDVSLEAAEKGKEYSRKLLSDKVTKGKMSQQKADKILSLIRTTDKVQDMKTCELVIEAVFENRELKAKVTQETEAVLPSEAVFASNTSTLPISSLAEASKKPDQFIGIHFFSPVDKMPLVEIIRGKDTSDETLALAIDYVAKIRKTPIVVNDSRGFYTSRVFKTYMFEGFELLKEGVAPALIENAGKSAGMPVGPLAVTDEVSLELVYTINKQTEKDLGRPVEAIVGEVAGPMIEKYQRLGKKSAKGFYEYPQNDKKHLWSGLSKLFPLADKQPDVKEISKRLLYRQALEAVKCLEQGVVQTAQDADIGSVLGWGFPAYTGGVISYIDMIGVAGFVKNCREMALKYGDRFLPTPGLLDMADKKATFYSVIKRKPIDI